MKDDVIILTDENGEEISFTVLEETRIGGKDYLLVSSTQEEDTCYILKDMSAPEDEEALYEFVEDDNELDYLMSIFSSLMEDVDVEFRTE